MNIKNKILIIIIFSTLFFIINRFVLEQFIISSSTNKSKFHCDRHNLNYVESIISKPVTIKGTNYLVYKGITGDKGDPGIEGNRGKIGPQGKQGPIGLVGPKGPVGPKGIGMRGMIGPNGPIGKKGKMGIKGAIGKQGNSSKLSLCAIPIQGDSKMKWNSGEDKPSILTSCLNKEDYDKINTFMERQPRSGIYEIISKGDYTKILSHKIDKSNLSIINGTDKKPISDSQKRIISTRKQINFDNPIPNEKEFSNKRVIIEKLNSKTGKYYNYRIYLYCVDETNKKSYNLTIGVVGNHLEIRHKSKDVDNKFVNFYSVDKVNFSNSLNINFKDGVFYPSYFIKYDNKFLKKLRKIQLTTNFKLDNNYIFLLKRIGNIPS